MEKSAAAAPAMDARRPIADEGWDVDAFSLESQESVARILVAARGARARRLIGAASVARAVEAAVRGVVTVGIMLGGVEVWRDPRTA
jgi:hypothetical protein